MDASVLNYTVNDNVGKFLKQTQKLYINGKWVDSKSGKTFDVEDPATGKKIELYQTVFNQAFLCLPFISLNFSYSIFSLANNCKTFIPVTLSWTNEFKLATSFLTSSKANFIYFWKILVAKSMNGNEIKTIKLNSQFM